MSADATTPHRATAELGPNVAGGVLRWLSATIISLADTTQDGGCLRKWHFRYVLRLDDPGTASQALGQAVHKVVEGYLRGEGWQPHPTQPKALRIAMAGARFLTPHVGEHLLIEHPLLSPEQVAAINASPLALPSAALLTAAGVPVAGHVDLYRGSARYVTPMGEVIDDKPSCAEVLDHKTTKALKWAKTGPALLDTVQMPLYAEWLARRVPELQHLRLSHVSYKTEGGPDACKSTTVVPREEIARRWERIERVAGTLVQVARVAPDRSNDVEGNRHACRAYNRPCAFADRCEMNRNRSLTDLLGGSMSTSLLDMFGDTTPAPAPSVALDMSAELAKLAAEETAARATAPATPTAPPPAPAVSPEFAAAVVALEACASALAPDGTAWGFPPLGGDAAQAWGAAKGMGVSAGAGLAGSGKLAKLPQVNDPAALIALARDLSAKVNATPVAPTPAAGLLPPEAPASNPALAADPVPGAPTLTVTEVTPPAPEAIAPAIMSATPAANVTTEDAAAKTAKRGRGRPRKTATTTTATAPVENTGDGFELFVDCYPHTGGFETLDAYVDEACELLCSKYECVDIRCADERTPLGFSKWKGVISAMVRAKPPAAGTYVLITDTEIKREIAAALAPLACGGGRGAVR